MIEYDLPKSLKLEEKDKTRIDCYLSCFFKGVQIGLIIVIIFTLIKLLGYLK